MCNICPVGYFCPNGQVLNACPGNASTNGTEYNTDIKNCTCNPGYVGFVEDEASICTACSLGEYCPGGNYSEICQAGRYCPTTYQTFLCRDNETEPIWYCPEGTYQEQFCPAGYQCEDTTTIAACDDPVNFAYYCPAGTRAQEGCPQGFFCPNSSVAIECAAGFSCPIGSLAANQCPAGFWCDATTGEPTLCVDEGDLCTAGTTGIPPKCPAGSYCPFSYSSIICSEGSYCPESSLADSRCEEGFFCPTTKEKYKCNVSGTYCPEGSTSVNDCPAGFYCPTVEEAIACASGEYCPIGSVNTADCKAGYYCSSTSEEEECQLGSYCPLRTLTEADCPADFYCPNASIAIACDAGFYCPGRAIEQIKCSIGFYCPLPSLQIECTESNFCPEGSSSLEPCEAGFYCPNASFIEACVAGQYCPTGSLAPQICEAGSFCPVPEQKTTCTSGEYCPENSTSFQICPVGYYCPNPSEIYPCAAGSTCPSGSFEELECPPGLFCPTPSEENLCSAGTYCPGNNTEPLECPIGYWCNPSTNLAECSIGEYCEVGTITPSQCESGYYCPTPSIKIHCGDGDYCPEGTSNLTKCLSGFYCPSPTTQLPCTTIGGAAAYCPEGSKSTSICPEQYYCPSPSTRIECVAGEYCEEGSISAVSCPAGSFCETTSTVIECSLGSYSQDQQTNCTLCDANHYCDQVALTTPIACPTGAISQIGSTAITDCQCDVENGFSGTISDTSDSCIPAPTAAFSITYYIASGGFFFMTSVILVLVCRTNAKWRELKLLLEEAVIVGSMCISQVFDLSTDATTFLNVVRPSQKLVDFVYPFLAVIIVATICLCWSLHRNILILIDLAKDSQRSRAEKDDELFKIVRKHAEKHYPFYLLKYFKFHKQGSRTWKRVLAMANNEDWQRRRRKYRTRIQSKAKVVWKLMRDTKQARRVKKMLLGDAALMVLQNIPIGVISLLMMSVATCEELVTPVLRLGVMATAVFLGVKLYKVSQFMTLKRKIFFLKDRIYFLCLDLHLMDLEFAETHQKYWGSKERMYQDIEKMSKAETLDAAMAHARIVFKRWKTTANAIGKSEKPNFDPIRREALEAKVQDRDDRYDDAISKLPSYDLKEDSDSVFESMNNPDTSRKYKEESYSKLEKNREEKREEKKSKSSNYPKTFVIPLTPQTRRLGIKGAIQTPSTKKSLAPPNSPSASPKRKSIKNPVMRIPEEFRGIPLIDEAGESQSGILAHLDSEATIPVEGKVHASGPVIETIQRAVEGEVLRSNSQTNSMKQIVALPESPALKGKIEKPLSSIKGKIIYSEALPEKERSIHSASTYTDSKRKVEISQVVDAGEVLIYSPGYHTPPPKKLTSKDPKQSTPNDSKDFVDAGEVLVYHPGYRTPPPQGSRPKASQPPITDKEDKKDSEAISELTSPPKLTNQKKKVSDRTKSPILKPKGRKRPHKRAASEETTGSLKKLVDDALSESSRAKSIEEKDFKAITRRGIAHRRSVIAIKLHKAKPLEKRKAADDIPDAVPTRSRSRTQVRRAKPPRVKQKKHVRSQSLELKDDVKDKIPILSKITRNLTNDSQDFVHPNVESVVPVRVEKKHVSRGRSRSRNSRYQFGEASVTNPIVSQKSSPAQFEALTAPVLEDRMFARARSASVEVRSPDETKKRRRSLYSPTTNEDKKDTKI